MDWRGNYEKLRRRKAGREEERDMMGLQNGGSMENGKEMKAK